MSEEIDDGKGSMSTGAGRQQRAFLEAIGHNSFRAAVNALKRNWDAQDLQAGENEPADLPLGEVVSLPKVFQVRGGSYADGQVDEAHLKDLRSALMHAGQLDPIVVWRCMGAWILIDGHHRLEAYRAEERPTIPVEVFRGTVEDALRKAGEGNSKAKLPMSQSERQDFAWRITSSDRPDRKDRWTWKKVEVVNTTGSRTSSVEKMRSTVRMMIQARQDPGFFTTWRSALDWRNGVERGGDIDADEMERIMADQLLAQLNKSVAKITRERVTPFAMALADFTGRSAPDLLAALADQLGIVVEHEDPEET